MVSSVELFRSEKMELMQLLVPAEAAHASAAALGALGAAQLKDLNAGRPAFTRPFAPHVKRCDEMARCVRVLEGALAAAGRVPATGGVASPLDAAPLDDLEAHLADLEARLADAATARDRVGRAVAELVELRLVLDVASTFFADARRGAAAAGVAAGAAGYGGGGGAAPPPPTGPDAPLLAAASAPPDPMSGGGGGGGPSASRRLGFVAGTVPDARRAAFERLLFRATRGNLLYRDAPVGAVADPASGEESVAKSVFVVFFAGERARAKALKICEACGANRYPFPDDPPRAAAMAAEVDGRLRELQAAVDAGERGRSGLLDAVSAGLGGWRARVAREKAIYHALNQFSVDVTRKVLVGEAWIPSRSRAAVAAALRAAAPRGSGGAALTPLLSYESPPTHFATDKVTACFQAIVDAYGVARYREANPALLTIVTFPFLFAVMFGDVGHAALMLLGSGALVLAEKRLAKGPLGDMGDMVFAGRYCILLMSVFSLFTGLIYNEAFSIPMSLFGRGRWACPTNPALTSPSHMRYDRSTCPAAFSDGLAPTGGTYGLGVDPAWHGARTELQFLNSVKMKASIVIGVVQMNAGIALSLLNQRASRDRLSTVTEFIPQVIFLNALFGYLCLLIVVKWATGSTADLYHTLIYMFLAPGHGGLTCYGGCPENAMLPGQGGLQVLLLLAAFVSVPWMLVPKPLILKKRWEARGAAAARYSGGGGDAHHHHASDDGGEGARLVAAAAPSSSAEGHGGGHGHDDGEFDFGEILVHQMIHTIEFVLGAVSNTASYLRLWALSLAHSQLSAVFYDRVLMAGVRSGSPVALFVAFFVFACATLGVLMVMETLSAFLHALRLHWVEFNNKFFAGDGWAFAPFVLPEA